MQRRNNTITDVPGIQVGHAQDEEANTGCSVVLCPKGSIGGVDQRGGAPGTRETDLLRPLHLVNTIHAVLLTGGSAYGLDAAAGVMQYLEEHNIGVETRAARVPIVSAAVLYDLDTGRPDIRPDKKMGYIACQNASSHKVMQGNYGAGNGARVGSIFGIEHAMKSGIGSSSIEIQQGLFVGALVAVNAFGDVVDDNTGQIIAGTRPLTYQGKRIGKGEKFANTLEMMRTQIYAGRMKFLTRENTVIGVIATNAKFNKEEINKVAQMAQNGIARTIRPAHTMYDGDTLFAIATNSQEADVNVIGSFAAEVLAQAVKNAVLSAKPAFGLPAASEYGQSLAS